MQRLLRSRKGQGSTEYIVILAIAVSIALAVFWPTIHRILQGKVSEIGGQIQTAGNNN